MSFQLTQSISIKKKETIFKVNCILTQKINKKEERSQCVTEEYLPLKSKETHQ